MNARAARAVVRGVCPGVLRPMESGDGLLVRVRPRAATLSLAEVRSIAEAARRFGNGHIDLTRRANVQIRGVTGATLPALTAHLSDAGLLDAAPEIEAVRNVVVSPLAGIDPSEVIDVRPIAHALGRLLAADARFWRLPAKFAFLIDGGGQLSLDGERVDLRLKATRSEGRIVMALAIDDARGPRWLGTVSIDDAVEAARRVALTFLETQAPGNRARMRDVGPGVAGRIREVLTDTFQTFESWPPIILTESGDPIAPPMTSSRRSWRSHASHGRSGPTQVSTPDRQGVVDPDLRRDDGAERGAAANHGGGRLIGKLAHRDEVFAVGLAAPFGRVDAEMLGALADALSAAGAQEMRLSPWRAVYAHVREWDRAAALVAAAERLGFIADSRDPRLAIEACPGAPSCRSAHFDTRAVAGAIAGFLPSLSGVGTVHVSGCVKGCACSTASDLVLAGDGDRIAIIRNGRADGVAEAHIPFSDLARLPYKLARIGGGRHG